MCIYILPALTPRAGTDCSRQQPTPPYAGTDIYIDIYAYIYIYVCMYVCVYTYLDIYLSWFDSSRPVFIVGVNPSCD